MTLTLFSASSASRLLTSWPWYVTRASGLIAAALLTMLMITGISMFTGYQFKFMAPLKSWANHRTLGIAFTLCIGIHGLSLLFDKYISFNLLQIFVPFASSYKQVKILGISAGSLGVAFGVISLYLVALIVYTSLTKTMSIRRQLWKTLHYLSYVVIVSVFLHSIMVGTDLSRGFWRATWIIINLVILGFVGIRLRRRNSLKG